MDQHTVAYCAGPMRSYPRLNFPAFDTAKDWLILKGWKAISPADLDREAGISGFTTEFDDDFVKRAMRRDIQALTVCNAIVFLPGWEKSEGANAEKFVAEQIGLPMYLINLETGELTEF